VVAGREMLEQQSVEGGGALDELAGFAR